MTTTAPQKARTPADFFGAKDHGPLHALPFEMARGVTARMTLVRLRKASILGERIQLVDRVGLEAAACECYGIVRNASGALPGIRTAVSTHLILS